MTRNGEHPKHTDRVRELARYIADQPDGNSEVSAQDILEAVKVGAAAASGKHAAMSKDQADEITLTDHGQPPRRVESDPPPSKLSPLAVVWVIAKKFPPWGAVLVALAGIAAYVMLKR